MEADEVLAGGGLDGGDVLGAGGKSVGDAVGRAEGSGFELFRVDGLDGRRES